MAVRVAFAIRKGRKLHMDKITPSAGECWGLLYDELAEGVPDRALTIDLRIVGMRRLGYECVPIEIHY